MHPVVQLVEPIAGTMVSFLTILSVAIASSLVGLNFMLLFSMALPTQDLAFPTASTVAIITQRLLISIVITPKGLNILLVWHSSVGSFLSVACQVSPN